MSTIKTDFSKLNYNSAFQLSKLASKFAQTGWKNSFSFADFELMEDLYLELAKVIKAINSKNSIVASAQSVIKNGEASLKKELIPAYPFIALSLMINDIEKNSGSEFLAYKSGFMSIFKLCNSVNVQNLFKKSEGVATYGGASLVKVKLVSTTKNGQIKPNPTTVSKDGSIIMQDIPEENPTSDTFLYEDNPEIPSSTSNETQDDLFKKEGDEKPKEDSNKNLMIIGFGVAAIVGLFAYLRFSK